MSQQKKIAVFGVGAIGSVVTFGIKDIHNLYYFNRSARQHISLCFNDEIMNKEIRLSNYTKELIGFDYLFICIKQYHDKEALPCIKMLLSPKTKLVIIRNGLDLKKPFLEIANENQLIECVIDCPTEELSKGQYVQLRKAVLFKDVNSNGDALSNLFIEDRIIVEEVDDFHSYKWKKLIHSSAIGIVQVFSGDTCIIFKDEKNLELYRKVLLEGMEVARSDGAIIEDQFYKDQLAKLQDYPLNKGSSMLSDYLRGRPIEWEAKNLVISKNGKQNNISTEYNDRLYAAIKKLKN